MAAIIQALTTLVLGWVAGFIAWRQWRTSHDRLVLDLFERRFQVFQELALLWQFTHAASRCQSIFDSAGIVSMAVER